jgi:hypothetical protein
MIHPLVKIITVDNFFTQDQAIQLKCAVMDLTYVDDEFGKVIPNFNMVAKDASETFSTILGTKMEVDHERSGVFRLPEMFIHFESFEDTNEWVFACALEQSQFDVFEHLSGAVTARDGYKFGYRNLFEWDLKINYILSPGQGVLFRPWLFHSFDLGLIQIFRLRELE